ncbi:MAG TPA: rod shape-determining protein MreC [Fibrobacteria bacterium]|nr:rod shape-determining protein MreC [Fibrobacteria bacterium]
MSLFDWILRIFTVWKGFFSLLVCLVASGSLVSLEPGERQTFHDVMISTFLYPAQAILSKLNRDIFIYKQNEELKRVNTALRLENDNLVQAIKRVPRLAELEAFGAGSGLPLKMAQISAEDPGRFSTNWVVNLGRQDSVDVNMPVLTWKGLVGRTAKCFRRHCLVQGLGDPSCKVSVLVNRSRMSGMLESWPGGRLVARFPRDSDVGEGDTLVTTGMGGVYPKGLMVGLVLGGMKDSDDMGDILRAVEVKPFQNPYLLEEVFVLIRQDSWTVGEE